MKPRYTVTLKVSLEKLGRRVNKRKTELNVKRLVITRLYVDGADVQHEDARSC